MLKAKRKIRQLIEQELEFANFKKEVSEEQRLALYEQASQELAEKSSFFFKFDKNKAKNNKEIID